MEDFTNTREQAEHQECLHQDSEQAPQESLPPASPLHCSSPHSVSTPAPAPAPAPAAAPGVPVAPHAGGNHVQRSALANGQASPPSALVRHTPREVPPRFRNQQQQQEPRTLLKRGQSLGPDTASPLHTAEPFTPNASDANQGPASTSFVSSSYANSTGGHGSIAQPLSQGTDSTLVVDDSDLETWPCIAQSQSGSGGASWGGVQGAQWTGQGEITTSVWGVRMEEEERPPNSRSDSGDICPDSDATDAVLTMDYTRSDSEQNECTFASVNLLGVSGEMQGGTEDERPEREVGPKQQGAAFACQVQESGGPPFDPNPATLRTEERGNGADVGETGGTWGTPEQSQEYQEGGEGSFGDGAAKVGSDCGESQGSSLSEQVATVQTCDSPPTGAGGSTVAASLQDFERLATNTTASDNQEGSQGGSVERGSSSDHEEVKNHNPKPTNCTEVSLQNVLVRSDLDPKVLCNSGWGQTRIQQGVAWELPEMEGFDRRSSGSARKKDGNSDVREWGDKGCGWGDEGQEKGGWGRTEGEWQAGTDRTGWGDATDNQRDRRGELGQGKKEDGDAWGIDERKRGWGGQEQQQGWGESPTHHHHHHVPNNQTTAPKGPNQQQQLQQQQQSQDVQPRGKRSQNSGWTSGPVPQASTGPGESSGWEEPSPRSLSRRTEIDDGTAAWGDPSHYGKNSLNMWDNTGATKTNPPTASRDKNAAGTWEQGGGPPESVDNNTAAWGKSLDAPSGWRDPEETGKVTGRGCSHGNAVKPGVKCVQDGWDEEVEEDVWGGSRGNSAASFSSGGWGQGQGARRGGGKGSVKGSGGESWPSSVSRQFSSMGIGQDEDAGLGAERHRRSVGDYNGEGRTRGGGRGGGFSRSQSSREPGPGDAAPYFGMSQLRGMQHHGNPSPGIRAQVPHQFIPPQVSGSVLKVMAPPAGGMFPSQQQQQQLAMLGVPPHMQHFQLACQLLLQQQQQQQHFLSQRKFPAPPPVRQQYDPQQLARIMALIQHQQHHHHHHHGPKLSPPPHVGAVSHQVDTTLLPPSVPQPELTPKPFPGYSSGAEPDSLIGGSVGGQMDSGAAQSRFKWAMEAGLPLGPSPSDHMMQKNGLLPGPLKLRGDSPYSQYDLETVGVASPSLTDSWHRNPGGKLGPASATPTWPPEFQPGVPWKGVLSVESDPYMSPAAVLESPIITDTEHQLLQDNTELSPSFSAVLPSPGAWPYSASDSSSLTSTHSAKLPDVKSSWPPEPIGHGKSWRTNRSVSHHLPRPPPGLTNHKQSSASPWAGGDPRPEPTRGWGPGVRSQEPFTAETGWSGGVSAGSSWLLLRNLTPQIDGSTLRTICQQHGPLMTFHLGLTQGSALIRYCSPHEAAKAQNALHMCVLGNTTILAEFVSDEEVERYLTHSHGLVGVASPDPSPVPSLGPAPTPDPVLERGGTGEVGVAWQAAGFGQWSGGGAEGQMGGVWGGVAPGYHGSSLWGTAQMEDGASGLLPGDLLGGGSDAL